MINKEIVIEAVRKIINLAKIAQRDRALKPIEKTLSKEMSAAFRAHQKVFMAEFEKSGPALFEAYPKGPVPVEGALDSAYQATLELFIGPIEEAAGAAIEAAAKHRRAEFSVNFAFGRKNPRAIEAIQKRAASAVSQIDETTRVEISKIVTRGMEDGYDYQKVARQITAKYEEFGVKVPAARHIRNRAQLIAINEAGDAYETGNRLVIEEMAVAGLEMEMFWSTVGDERVSDGCKNNSAVGWIPITSSFPSGHQHSPRFPGCRCATLYRRKPTPQGVK